MHRLSGFFLLPLLLGALAGHAAAEATAPAPSLPLPEPTPAEVAAMKCGLISKHLEPIEAFMAASRISDGLDSIDAADGYTSETGKRAALADQEILFWNQPVEGRTKTYFGLRKVAPTRLRIRQISYYRYEDRWVCWQSIAHVSLGESRDPSPHRGK